MGDLTIAATNRRKNRRQATVQKSRARFGVMNRPYGPP